MADIVAKSKAQCKPGQLFADPRDTLTDECMVEEMYFSHLAPHRLHILDQSANGGTDLYGDPAKEPVYSQTYKLPMLIKLDPEEEELNKYGYDRTREFMIWFSRKICHDLGIVPKVGDRIDMTYRDPVGAIINEHIIINEISPVDFQRQLIDHYSILAAGNRTHKLYQPNPPGVPEDPPELPFDVDCLKNI